MCIKHLNYGRMIRKVIRKSARESEDLLSDVSFTLYGGFREPENYSVLDIYINYLYISLVDIRKMC